MYTNFNCQRLDGRDQCERMGMAASRASPPLLAPQIANGRALWTSDKARRLLVVAQWSLGSLVE